MGIEALTPPRRTRGSKYDRTPEEVEQTIELLNAGENPGEAGFESEGEARSSAARLIQQCEDNEEAPTEIGSRTWGDEEEGYSFALKIGKRKISE